MPRSSNPGDPDSHRDLASTGSPQSSDGVSRRTVVLGLGGAATAALVAVLVGTQLADDDPTTVDDQGPADQPSTDEAIKRVGEAYRSAYPEDDSRDALEAALPRLEGLSGQQVQEQLATLRDQVRADFADGRVVTVDGWLLAVTEARAAALVSILG